MRILFVSSEVAPFAKTGGLGDVSAALPRALRANGHDVRLVLPFYQRVRAPDRVFERVVPESEIVLGGRRLRFAIHTARLPDSDAPVYFVDCPPLYDRPGIYTQDPDEHLRFALLGWAALKLCQYGQWSPDVVHCNDWQTGFIPVLMREKYSPFWSQTASIFTIHNLAYQGEFDLHVLDMLKLSKRLFNPEQLETWGRVNFLKAGCVYADHVNTVSPRYAEEIQTPQFGCMLEGLMVHLAKQDRLDGILNGLDLDAFNPETDPALPANFSSEDESGKITCKARLQSELELPVKPSVPLLGIVSRLSTQKGLDLVLEIIPKLAELPAQLIVQGLGDPAIADRLRELAKAFPDCLRFVEEFNAELAQRVYAGCDMFLMPSAFEPCGLGQMIAMRYGTVPIVRKTGGLADTVFEGDNGFVFDNSSPEELWEAICRASEAFTSRTQWGLYVSAGMSSDFSWDKSAVTYADLYGRAVGARSVVLEAAAS